MINTNNFFNLVAEDLQLGKVLENPVQVTGGFMYRMFKIVTEKGSYIIKLLNPNIMKRPTAATTKSLMILRRYYNKTIFLQFMLWSSRTEKCRN